uniref:Subtilase family protein n=1 Tax=Rhizobium rhizogenes TaxID=359 RepID=A0A7S4ZRR3_RHIRH|nr:S8 family serine peptidase [Rhizobium rhizogenes]QCL09635.1 subtilase family protein [Rhizobium rhizogenes]
MPKLNSLGILSAIILTLAGTVALLDNALAQTARPQLLIRATSAVPDSVIAYIADISEPQQSSIPPNVRPEDFIASTCGVLTDTYRDKIKEINPDLLFTPTAKTRLVKLPACLRWTRPGNVEVQDGELLDDVLDRSIGRTSQAILKPCEINEVSSRCGTSLRDMVAKLNPGFDLDKLTPSTKLVLPLITQWTTVNIKEGSVTPAQAAQKINDLVAIAIKSSNSIDGEFAPIIVNRPAVQGIDLVHTLEADDPLTDAPSCKNAGQMHDAWPFDIKAVVSTLKENVGPSGFAGTVPTTIVIADTGITAEGFNALKKSAKPNDLEIPLNYKDDNGDGYTDDIYGIDTDLKGDDLTPFSAYSEAEHGTEVAKLAAGIFGAGELDHTIRKLIRFKFIKIVAQDSATGSFEIPEHALEVSAAYAAKFGDILNLSVGTTQPLPAFMDDIGQHSNLLIVTAAGNDAGSLGSVPSYPANYGGDGHLRDQMITVGASDGNEGLAHFSMYSRQYVDLLAPGCALPYVRGQDKLSISGTSFSAPLVSLTSALLRSLGLNSPRTIKDRLLVSVDYDHRLWTQVLDGGTLNIIKALNVRRNIVQFPNGSIKAVSPIDSGPTQYCPDSLPIDFSAIRKISSYVTGGARHIRVLFSDSQGMFDFQYCTPLTEGIMIAGADGSPTILSWSDFSDYIPATLH